MTFFVDDSCPDLNGDKKRYDGLEEALIRASLHNDTDLARQLLNHGAQADYVAEAIGNTPLLISFRRSNLPLAELLVSAGASKDFPSRSGVTPVKELEFMVNGSPFPVRPAVIEFARAAAALMNTTPPRTSRTLALPAPR